VEDQETEEIVTLRQNFRTGDETSSSAYTVLFTAPNFVMRYYDCPLMYVNSVASFETSVYPVL
jgi:hypothetical protein